MNSERVPGSFSIYGFKLSRVYRAPTSKGHLVLNGAPTFKGHFVLKSEPSM